jgi:putative tricarboxylic transport membrane protein
MYIGNAMLLALNLPLIGMWVRLLKVPYNYMAAGVLLFCIIGAYSVNNSAFDVGTMVVFGAVGYFLRKGGFPAAPLVLAIILGPQLERTLQQSLIGAGGDPRVFVHSPISATLLVVAAGLVASPGVRWLWHRHSSQARTMVAST